MKKVINDQLVMLRGSFCKSVDSRSGAERATGVNFVSLVRVPGFSILPFIFCTMCVVISVYKDIMELGLPLLRLRSSKRKVHWLYFSVNYLGINFAAKERRTTVVLD